MPRLWAKLALAVLAGGALFAPAAAADQVAAFYRGKTVTLVVGYGESGGYNVYARVLANHIGRYIPGNPVVVVQNMRGGRSLRAVNWLYNLAPRDGTIFAHFGRNMPLIGMLGANPYVQFDPRKLTWLGSSSSFADDAYILIVRAGSVKSIEDVRRGGGEPLVLGSAAESASGDDIPIILRDTIGLNLRKVVGYADSGALFRAMQRGEVQGRTIELSWLRATRPELLKPGSGFHVLVQFARETRHPDFPAVPTARELARNEKARLLIELTELPYKLSRPFAAPPSVPSERAAALQRAFAETHRDPEYLAEAAKQRIDVSPVTAEQILAALRRIDSAPAQQVDYLRRLFGDARG